MTTEPAPINEGEIIAGKYRVGRVLGQGGMGVVVVATHLQLGQRVALKFLLPDAMRHPDVVTRFTREAQAAAKIQSEHVARVLDVGELESGAPYMVMEYLEGEDLERTLGSRGPLPIAEAVEYLLQGCEAVAEAHSLGIIHRDIKPANLFLAKRSVGKPIVKVLDFGISKSPVTGEHPELTQTTSMFGSPPYMSPEQVKSTRSADARSDIWSLGAVLYELLTLRQPFQSESIPALYVAILYQDPEPTRAHRAEIPPLLDAAVMRCLQKDPALRFPDVATLASAIAPFGPPSGAQSVERIWHVLGVGRPRNEPAFQDSQRAAAPRGVAAIAGPSTAVGGITIAPTASAGSSVVGAVGSLETVLSPPTRGHVGASPRPSAPSPIPAPTPSSVPGSVAAVAAVADVAPEPPPSVNVIAVPTPALAPLVEARAPSRDRTTRAMLAAAAIIAVGASGTAYWYGARRARGPGDVPPAGPIETSQRSTTTAAATGTAPPPLGGATPDARSIPARRPGTASRPRARSAAVEARAATFPSPTDDSPRSAPSHARSGAPAAVCADLLERQSLGETLTLEEKAVYAHDCSK